MPQAMASVPIAIQINMACVSEMLMLFYFELPTGRTPDAERPPQAAQRVYDVGSLPLNHIIPKFTT